MPALLARSALQALLERTALQRPSRALLFAAQGLAFLLTVCSPLTSLLVSLVLACLVNWYIHDDPVTPPARSRWQDDK